MLFEDSDGERIGALAKKTRIERACDVCRRRKSEWVVLDYLHPIMLTPETEQSDVSPVGDNFVNYAHYAM
jgi:hypothetical protein